MIGLIGALDIEVESLRAQMQDAQTDKIGSIEYTAGLLEGRPVVIACCGVGKVNAAVCAQTMILRYEPKALIFTGIAGAMGEGIRIGDLVVADRLVEHDFDTRPLDSAPGVIWGSETTYFTCDENLNAALIDAIEAEGLRYRVGLIASGDQFIHTEAQRSTILTNYPATEAAEMEGAAVAHVCTLSGIPFAVLRAISDGADEGSEMTYPEFRKLAAERSVAVTRRFLQCC